MNINHDYFMGLALDEARHAMDQGEFPVGCIITDGVQVLASGRRTKSVNAERDEISHAEIVTLQSLYRTAPPGAKWPPLFLYTTLEPCLMCFGAALLSPVETIVYAYEDVMGGGTGCDRSILPTLYRKKNLTMSPMVRREESVALFKTYFRNPENDYWRDSLLATYTLAQ